ncbi:MAG: rod shape-determining protein [bacterium]
MGLFKGVQLGIDLGTRNLLVFLRGHGVVLNEPAVVAVDKRSNTLLAIGTDAQRMLGRTPGNIVAFRPLKGGVIADYELAQQMILGFMKRIKKYIGFSKPSVLIGVPWGITAVEQRAVYDAIKQSEAKKITLIYEPLAAAIGAKLDVMKASGFMIVDIGGGTTEVAVISLGGLVLCKSIRVAGDDFDDAIIQHCRRAYNLLIGERMAEQIKITLGSAYPLKEEMYMEVSGRDLMTGLPKTFKMSSYEIRDALSELCVAILSAIRLTLEQTPPELSSDIMQKGILLTGGGALLLGLVDYLESEIGLPVSLVDDPISAVAYGTGDVLERKYKVQHMSSVLAS